jgi:L-asparaginase II
MKHTFEPLVEVTRGSIAESIHFGSVVVCDNRGNILFNLGDPELITYLRSTAKPLQVVALMENSASQAFQFTDEEIAIMCASHSGTDQHVAVLKTLQKKLGISQDDLQCGMHLPFDRITSNQIIRGEAENSRLRHNCSGKHSGMLALAGILAAPKENYLDPNSPTQQLILRTCGEMFAYPAVHFEMGVDGCSAPVFAVPMRNAAQAYALLCQPDLLTEQRARACQRITHAMMAHPFLVAGPERFDTALMEALPGKVIAKTGAEGYFGVGVMPNAIYPNSPALGIMVKISDGDLKDRARSIVLVNLLRHLGLVTAENNALLADYDNRSITNWRNIPVGEIRPTAQLMQALNSWEIGFTA